MEPSHEALIARHRSRIEEALGAPLRPPDPPVVDLRESERSHLLGEARDLYWNELEWERLTDEEKIDGGALPELTFSGFLAFVRGLLMREAMPDALAPANPRPEVVEDILHFLAERLIALQEGDSEGDASEDARLTEELVDLVLYQLHGLSKEEVARVEGRIRSP